MTMPQETYLITGAGSGLGKGVALKLAAKGFDVIAGVETLSDVALLEQEAQDKKLTLRVEKLDITDSADRERAWTWEPDVLINNAGVSYGGAMTDIPEAFLREQFEVNVFGTIFLTQGIARQMAKKRSGKIIFVSSLHGIMADPFSGPYCGSKYALEAFGEAMAQELQEFNIEVQMINPGPYLTGFNDREYETWKRWNDDPTQRLFDYENLAFPYEQLDPEKAIKDMVKFITKSNDFRNITPKALKIMAKKRQSDLWKRKSDADLGHRHPLIRKSNEIEPATTPTEGIIDKIKDTFS